MSFRACVYPSDEEQGHYIAHCLELDVLGEGQSVEEAVSELLEVIETQLESCKETGAQLQFFAPRHVWEKYNAAQKNGRTIAEELLKRIIRDANKRMGMVVSNVFDNIVGTKDVPKECMMA